MKRGHAKACADGKPKPTKKPKTKSMTKNQRKALQDSLRSINPRSLIYEAVSALKEQFQDGSQAPFVTAFCEVESLLKDIAEFHRDTFAALHCECKTENNAEIQFHLKWHHHCSAFLLEEKHSLSTIGLEEEKNPVLTNLRYKWLEFCRKNSTPLPASKPAMMAFTSALYHSLLEHLSLFQSNETSVTEPAVVEEDGVYYQFCGAALSDMLHRRYKQISGATNKNLMSIEISILQAILIPKINLTYVPDYLKY